MNIYNTQVFLDKLAAVSQQNNKAHNWSQYYLQDINQQTIWKSLLFHSYVNHILKKAEKVVFFLMLIEINSIPDNSAEVQVCHVNKLEQVWKKQKTLFVGCFMVFLPLNL